MNIDARIKQAANDGKAVFGDKEIRDFAPAILDFSIGLMNNKGK